ncbi:glycoside hydrolase family 5 protein [Neolentinus lepideus HHB14362 ss-1]|uniref:glucan 1,3-beta-glucosidase n=1 Tax=Neolentinus lepideus HHB14362 ss-1 TaxID=1314782 RepID=A0A165UBE5_9AGAM|nr:glycoside hydrolase family 5 protein [Neolentinus lepideus HHB14362 ss-1]
MSSSDSSSTAYKALPNVPGRDSDSDYDNDDPRSLSYQHGAGLNTNPTRPHFMGAALAGEAGSSRPSFDSGHQTYPSFGDNNSSVYALNPQDVHGTPESEFRDGSQYFGYRDDSFDASRDVPMHPVGSPQYLEEKRAVYAPPRRRSRVKMILFGVLGGVAALIIIVVLAVYFGVVKKNNDKTTTGDSVSNPTGTSSAGGGGSSGTLVVTGGGGSTVTTDNGTTFTYQNSFGGYWYWDPNDPFNNGARAQSWSPALNETFHWGVDKIRGVNIGGWLVTEPFSIPSLYEKYPQAVDEWTLSEAMANDTGSGGLSQLNEHYETFITEEDFAQIAGAGLNFVRIPLPYWAIETRGDEPYNAKVPWTYFLKAIRWARKYGLRINLDLHALPGSQNEWNHSGRMNDVNFLNGPMGIANAQRSLDYIRIIAEFISQDEYTDVVVMFGITNEPEESIFGLDNLQRYYLQAYNNVRLASGTGTGNGPMISYHDGFLPVNQWAGFMPGADRIALDDHPYICFAGQSAAPMSSYNNTPCVAWGSNMNTSMSAFGLTAAGEWSNAVTDCGKWLNGVGEGARYDGSYPGSTAVGTCDTWTDWPAWDDDMKSAIKQFALASMDALQNWFFWTWKIGNSTVTGKVESPAWSYQLGLQNGWMPTDPREAVGMCGNSAPWQPPLAPSATGGSGAGQIPASVSASLPWPPTTISNGGPGTALPTYTPTGTVPTLTAETFSSATGTAKINAGNGWANSQDTAGLMVAIATCSYLDPWVGPGVVPPSPLCSSSARKREAHTEPAPMPVITSPPLR